MSGLVKLAWRNMWRNGRRSVIALVTVAMGVMLMVFMDGLFAGSDQAIFGNAVRLYGGNIQVHGPGYRQRAKRMPLIPLADAQAVLDAVSEEPEVTRASLRIVTAGMVTDRGHSQSVVLTGLEPSAEEPTSLIAQNIVEGRFLLDEDGEALVMGRALADYLGVGVGDRPQVLARGEGDTAREQGLTVVGIYDLGVADVERRMLFVNLPTAQALLRIAGQATEVSIALDRVGGERAVIAQLEEALPGYEIDSWETLRPELRQTLDTKIGFTTFFGMVVLFIACVGILNLMLMAVFERTREMGVLAALGMRNRQVLALYLLEGTFIGLLGAVAGCAVGLAIIWLTGRVGIDLSYAAGMGGDLTVLLGDRLRPVPDTGKLIDRGLVAALMAAAASLLPAWRASRQQPAEVLHHV